MSNTEVPDVRAMIVQFLKVALPSSPHKELRALGVQVVADMLALHWLKHPAPAEVAAMKPIRLASRVNSYVNGMVSRAERIKCGAPGTYLSELKQAVNSYKFDV